MIQINLLPWREQQRAHEKKLFLGRLVLCVAISLGILFFINLYITKQVNNQLVRNKLLTDEIAAYTQQLKEIKKLENTRQLLAARMAVIRNLQGMRVLIVHLFDELIQVIPDEIYLIKIEGKNNRVSITGYADSNYYISKLMKNIENNSWIHNTVLTEIKKMERKKRIANNKFKLTFTLESSRVT